MTPGAALVFGLGDVASAVGHVLHRAGWRVALAADAPPRAHRRRMAFADAWWDGVAVLEGVFCHKTEPAALAAGNWPAGAIPFLRLAPGAALGLLPWTLAVDGRVAKRSAPLTLRGRAPLTLGCGPGHVAGTTCDLAIETQRGDRLGAIIAAGLTAPLSGEPHPIAGIGRARIVYAPAAGRLSVLCDIGAPVTAGQAVARLGPLGIAAPLAGTLRGIMRDGSDVAPGDKLCEVDPRPPESAQVAGLGARPLVVAQGVLRAAATCLSG